MLGLKLMLEREGFENVRTYIQSGNVILGSSSGSEQLGSHIELLLSRWFQFDSDFIKVLAVSHQQLESIVQNKPPLFGEQPDKFHYDVIFLMGVSADYAMLAFAPREGVDTIWPGDGVIYSQRVSEQRSKSRLNKIMSAPLYQFMTIRNWNTTTKLLAMMREVE